MSESPSKNKAGVLTLMYSDNKLNVNIKFKRVIPNELQNNSKAGRPIILQKTGTKRSSCRKKSGGFRPKRFGSFRDMLRWSKSSTMQICGNKPVKFNLQEGRFNRSKLMESQPKKCRLRRSNTCGSRSGMVQFRWLRHPECQHFQNHFTSTVRIVRADQ